MKAVIICTVLIQIYLRGQFFWETRIAHNGPPSKVSSISCVVPNSIAVAAKRTKIKTGAVLLDNFAPGLIARSPSSSEPNKEMKISETETRVPNKLHDVIYRGS